MCNLNFFNGRSRTKRIKQQGPERWVRLKEKGKFSHDQSHFQPDQVYESMLPAKAVLSLLFTPSWNLGPSRMGRKVIFIWTRQRNVDALCRGYLLPSRIWISICSIIMSISSVRSSVIGRSITIRWSSIPINVWRSPACATSVPLFVKFPYVLFQIILRALW